MKKIILPLAAMVVSLLAYAQEYKTITDIPYRAVNNDAYSDERCKLDVQYKEGARDLPVVVFFEGGGMTKGEKYIPDPLGECGYVIVPPPTTACFPVQEKAVAPLSGQVITLFSFYYRLDGFDHLTMVKPGAELLRDLISHMFPEMFPYIDWREYL